MQRRTVHANLLACFSQTKLGTLDSDRTLVVQVANGLRMFANL